MLSKKPKFLLNEKIQNIGYLFSRNEFPQKLLSLNESQFWQPCRKGLSKFCNFYAHSPFLATKSFFQRHYFPQKIVLTGGFQFWPPSGKFFHQNSIEKMKLYFFFKKIRYPQLFLLVTWNAVLKLCWKTWPKSDNFSCLSPKLNIEKGVFIENDWLWNCSLGFVHCAFNNHFKKWCGSYSYLLNT